MSEQRISLARWCCMHASTGQVVLADQWMQENYRRCALQRRQSPLPQDVARAHVCICSSNRTVLEDKYHDYVKRACLSNAFHWLAGAGFMRRQVKLYWHNSGCKEIIVAACCIGVSHLCHRMLSEPLCVLHLHNYWN